MPVLCQDLWFLHLGKFCVWVCVGLLGKGIERVSHLFAYLPCYLKQTQLRGLPLSTHLVGFNSINQQTTTKAPSNPLVTRIGTVLFQRQEVSPPVTSSPTFGRDRDEDFTSLHLQGSPVLQQLNSLMLMYLYLVYRLLRYTPGSR